MKYPWLEKALPNNKEAQQRLLKYLKKNGISPGNVTSVTFLPGGKIRVLRWVMGGLEEELANVTEPAAPVVRMAASGPFVDCGDGCSYALPCHSVD